MKKVFLLCLSMIAGFAIFAGACSPDGAKSTEEATTSETSGQEKQTSEAASKEMGATDAGAPEQTAPETTTENPPEKPTGNTKEIQALKPFSTGRWRIVTLPPGGMSNFVGQALDRGTFQYPEKDDYLGYKWKTVTPDSKGMIGIFPASPASYATTQITVQEETPIVVRADTIGTVYFNGARYIGDYYGSRGYRIPLILKPGKNVIVVRVMGGRSKKPEFFAWSAPYEVYPNRSDLTAPSLRVNDQTEQCLGMPIMNLVPKHISNFKAEVLENDHFESTSITYPSLPKGTGTQVAFLLKPKKKFEKEKEEIPIRLRFSSPDLKWSYTYDLKQTTISGTAPYRGTRISGVDKSCQFHGVNPPKDFDPNKKYSLILSLHGAGVNALGQARSYSQKDWAFLVAPTNRRPFGFDWEAWGRLDGLEALKHAMNKFPIDPKRVYVTGHSMGGHGTWQFGVLFPGKFALVGPSAGWSSFYSYTGARRPSSIFKRSQASSETNNYLSNLAKRTIYIVHGGNDRNVPTREGRDMFAAAKKISSDVHYHEEPGVGHWWNKKDTPGADCVDWKPMMDMIQKRTLDPTELNFTFKTPNAWVSPTHSYASILTSSNPLEDMTLVSKQEDKKVTLTTTNVAAMILDGKALKAKGITSITVDQKDYPVQDGPMTIGPQDGKRPGVHGPVNEVWHSPFCYVYPDDQSPFAHYIAYLTSGWSFLGNGSVICSMPFAKLTDEVRKEYNIIYVGIPSSQIKAKQPFQWDESTVTMGTSTYKNVAMATVFPENGKLSAAFFATKGSEYLLFNIMPYTSRFVFPDYLAWTSRGIVSGGFFDAAWKFNTKYKVGQ